MTIPKYQVKHKVFGFGLITKELNALEDSPEKEEAIKDILSNKDKVYLHSSIGYINLGEIIEAYTLEIKNDTTNP